MTFAYSRIIAYALSVAMGFSVLPTDSQAFEAGASERSVVLQTPPSVLTSDATILMGDEAAEEEVEMTEATVDIGGLSSLLSGYYDALSRGDVSAAYEVELARVVDDDIDAKAAVLDDYENLGIVQVEGYLNVRETPESNGRIIGKMLNNCACDILQVLDGWYYITSGEVTGYICADYLVTGDDAVRLAIDDAKLRVTCETDCLNVRAEASVESEVITQLNMNDRYDVEEDLGDWVRISLGGEEFGYVSAEYVTVSYSLMEAIVFVPVDANTLLRNNIVNFALQFLGNPYVWGGTSLYYGADCSGFTQSVMANFGIWLSRTSREQRWNGTEVAWNEIQPGDLVFYGSYGVVTHVAIYIGNGQIVHAISEARGIGITSMWFTTPMGYRNVIGE